MTLRVSGKNLDVGDVLRTRIEARIAEAIEKYFDRGWSGRAILEKEGSIHISNVMYYREELKRPVRIKIKMLDDGRKVRGFVNPQTKAFEQIDV